MRMHSKLILAALAATTLLGIGVTSASARHLSTRERRFEMIWNEILGSPRTKLELTAPAASVNIRCRVTYLGDFTESTISKETSFTQALVFHAELESCTGGTVTLRTETMPWSARYRSFTGTLPRIRSVTLGQIGVVMLATAGGLTCEAATEVNHPAVSIIGNSTEAAETGFETTGEPENVTAEKGNRIPLSGSFLCAFGGESEIGGIGELRNLPRTAKVKFTLI